MDPSNQIPITTEEFDADLALYRSLSKQDIEAVSSLIDGLRSHEGSREDGTTIRHALREALIQYGVRPRNDRPFMTATEYDDILWGQKLYQELQED
jgi:hypothetical protein